MPALDTLILRQGLADDLGSQFYRQYLESWYDSQKPRFFTESPDGIRLNRSPVEQGLIPDDVEHFRRRLTHSLQMAHNFYVTPEMQVLVTAAAERMPEDEPVRADDFPTQQGWFWIPGGITEIDARGTAMPTSGILWDVYGGIVNLTYFVDKFHPLDQLRAEANPAMPRLTPWCVLRMDLDAPITKSLTLGVVVPPELASEIHIARTASSTSISFPKGFDPSALAPAVRPDQVATWLLSCLRLMQQPLTTVTDQGVPASLRRSLRGKVRLRNTAVTVIEYRRRDYHYDDGESGRTFTHRFLRRGHWRQQPYKTQGGEWDRKRIWIHPTIVGDAKLPLLLRDHVNALIR